MSHTSVQTTRFVLKDDYRTDRQMDRQYMDGRFARIDEKFAKVDQSIEDLRGEMRSTAKDIRDEIRSTCLELRIAITRLEIKGRNSKSKRPIHSVIPVSVFRGGSEVWPSNKCFPTTVRDFWKLQGITRRDNLEYLVRFYAIDNFHLWPQIHRSIQELDTESSESFENDDDGADQTIPAVSFVVPSLEDSVAAYPLVALSELAKALGLPFDKIQEFIKAAAELRQTQATLDAVKRRQTGGATQELAKRQRLPSPPAGLRSVPLEVLLEMGRDSSPPSSENETRLTWDKPHLNPTLGVISEGPTIEHARHPLVVSSKSKSTSPSSVAEEGHSTGAQPLDLRHSGESQSETGSKAHSSVGTDDKTEEFSSDDFREIASRIKIRSARRM